MFKLIKYSFLVIISLCSCEVEKIEIDPLLVGKWGMYDKNFGIIIEDKQTAYFWTDFTSSSSQYEEYKFDNVLINNNNIFLEFISPPVFDSLVYEVVIFHGTYNILSDNHFILSGAPVTFDASESIGLMMFDSMSEGVVNNHYYKL